MQDSTTTYVEKFKVLLEKELDNLSQLYEIELCKYDALKDVDLKALNRINSVEEEIVSYIDTLEKERRDTVFLLSNIFGFDPSIKLSDIVNYFPEEIVNEILVIREKIKEISNKLSVTIQTNKRLIESNLDIIRFTMGFTSKRSIKSTYDYRNKHESRETLSMFNQFA